MDKSRGFLPEGDDEEGAGGFIDQATGDKRYRGSSSTPQTIEVPSTAPLDTLLTVGTKLPFGRDVLGVFGRLHQGGKMTRTTRAERESSRRSDLMKQKTASS